MIAFVNLLGQGVALLYVVGAPFAAYFLFRKAFALRARDLALGLVGGCAMIGLLYPLSYGAPILFTMVADTLQPHMDVSIFLFLERWFGRSVLTVATALIEFAVLSRFASERKGLGAGLAYGVASVGVFDIAVRGPNALLYWQWAWSALVNNVPIGEEWAAVLQRAQINLLGYGLPFGAGAITDLVIGLGLAVLVWMSVLEKRRGWLVVAITASVALVAPFALIQGFRLPIRRETFDSVMGLALVALAYWREPVRKTLSAAIRGSGLAGLVTAWLAEGRPHRAEAGAEAAAEIARAPAEA